MRTFSELTELEIRDLTDEQVEQFIKLEFAENGVKLMEEPCEPEYIQSPKGDITHYLVGSFRFKDRDEADKVAATLRACNSMIGYTYKSDFVIEQPLERYNEVCVTEQNVFNVQRIKKISDINSKNKEAESIYESALTIYEENEKLAEPIRLEIYSKVNGIKSKFNHMDRLAIKFESEYLPLADGDTDKAMAFFKKAYEVNEESEKYILQ